MNLGAEWIVITIKPWSDNVLSIEWKEINQKNYGKYYCHEDASSTRNKYLKTIPLSTMLFKISIQTTRSLVVLTNYGSLTNSNQWSRISTPSRTIEIDIFFLCTTGQKLGFGLESSKIHCDPLCFSQIIFTIGLVYIRWFPVAFFFGGEGEGGEADCHQLSMLFMDRWICHLHEVDLILHPFHRGRKWNWSKDH